jgi:hypothetical protein
MALATMARTISKVTYSSQKSLLEHQQMIRIDFNVQVVSTKKSVPIILPSGG